MTVDVIHDVDLGLHGTLRAALRTNIMQDRYILISAVEYIGKIECD